MNRATIDALEERANELWSGIEWTEQTDRLLRFLDRDVSDLCDFARDLLSGAETWQAQEARHNEQMAQERQRADEAVDALEQACAAFEPIRQRCDAATGETVALSAENRRLARVADLLAWAPPGHWSCDHCPCPAGCPKMDGPTCATHRMAWARAQAEKERGER